MNFHNSSSIASWDSWCMVYMAFQFWIEHMLSSVRYDSKYQNPAPPRYLKYTMETTCNTPRYGYRLGDIHIQPIHRELCFTS